MVGYPGEDATRRFREIAALLEQARDALTAFAEQLTDDDYDQDDFKIALERVISAASPRSCERWRATWRASWWWGRAGRRVSGPARCCANRMRWPVVVPG